MHFEQFLLLLKSGNGRSQKHRPKNYFKMLFLRGFKRQSHTEKFSTRPQAVWRFVPTCLRPKIKH